MGYERYTPKCEPQSRRVSPVLTFAKTLLVLAAMLLLLVLAGFIASLMQWPGHPGLIGAVQFEAQQTRKMVDAQLTAELKVINGQLSQTSSGLLEKTDKLTGSVEGLSGALQTEIEDLRSKTDPILLNTRHISDVARDNADLLGDCESNPDCFANRAIPALKNFELASGSVQKVADSIAKETPSTAQAIRESSQSTAKILNQFAKPKNKFLSFL